MSIKKLLYGFIAVLSMTCMLRLNILSVEAADPLDPPSVTAIPGRECIVLTWEPVSGATDYVIYTYKDDGSLSEKGTTSDTFYKVSSLPAGKEVKYIVRAKNDDTLSEYTQSDVVYTTPLTMTEVTTGKWIVLSDNGVEWNCYLDESMNIIGLYTTQNTGNITSYVDNGRLKLPSMVSGFIVTGIGGGSQTKPVIPASIQYTSIDIPSTVTTIESYAFYGHTSEADIVIEGKKTINTGAFANTHFKSLTFHNVSGSVYSGICDNSLITSVTINGNANGLTIYGNAFRSMSRLESVSVAGNVSLKENAFYSCPALNTLSYDAPTLPGNSFVSCTGIKTIKFGINTNTVKYNWNGTSVNTSFPRSIYVRNGETLFEFQTSLSSFGNGTGTVNVFYNPTDNNNNLNLSGTVLSGNISSLREHGAGYESYYKANGLTVNLVATEDADSIYDAPAILSKEMTGISASVHGIMQEDTALSNDRVTVYRMSGNDIIEVVSPDDYYIARTSEYLSLGGNITRERVAAISPVVFMSDEAQNKTKLIDAKVIYFDTSNRVFTTDIVLRLEPEDDKLLVNGNIGTDYTDIWAKMKDLQTQVNTLKGQIADTPVSNLSSLYTQRSEAEERARQINVLIEEQGTLKTSLLNAAANDYASGVISTQQEYDDTIAQINENYDEAVGDLNNRLASINNSITRINQSILDTTAMINCIKEYEQLYESIAAELTSYRNDAYIALDYYGYDESGNYCIYIDGHKCINDVNDPGFDCYMDGVKYHGQYATGDYNGSGVQTRFRYIATFHGVYVISDTADINNLTSGVNAVLYDQTFSSAIGSAYTLLNEVRDTLNELNTICTQINDFVADMENAGYDIEGDTESENLTSIREAVLQLILQYNNKSEDLLQIKAALFGGTLSEAELDAKDVNAVIEYVALLNSNVETICAKIESTLTGSVISASEAKTLNQLLDDIRTLKRNLTTDDSMLEAIKSALEVDNSNEILNAISDLYSKYTEENRQNKALSKTNETLTLQLESYQRRFTSMNDQYVDSRSTITDLTAQNRALTSENSNLKSQNDTLTAQKKKLTEQVDSLTTRNKDLSDEIAYLKANGSGSQTWNGGYDKNGKYTGDGEYDIRGTYVGPNPNLIVTDEEKEDDTGTIEVDEVDVPVESNKKDVEEFVWDDEPEEENPDDSDVQEETPDIDIDIPVTTPDEENNESDVPVISTDEGVIEITEDVEEENSGIPVNLIIVIAVGVVALGGSVVLFLKMSKKGTSKPKKAKNKSDEESFEIEDEPADDPDPNAGSEEYADDPVPEERADTSQDADADKDYNDDDNYEDDEMYT